MTLPLADAYDARRVPAAAGLLRAFWDNGILESADVHTAATLGRISSSTDEAVMLAAALAVRAVRLGHVYVDLASIAETAIAESDSDVDVEVDLAALPWPGPGWIDQVAGSTMTATGDAVDSPTDRPLRLLGTRLYLDRYWRHERTIVDALVQRADADAPPVDHDLLAAGVERLFPRSVEPDGGEPDLQRVAAATAVLRSFAVVAGGPGTGKTTTVARILALVLEQAHAAGGDLPRIALAAPTGKAGARLAEAVHAEAATLDTEGWVRDVLLGLSASTLHRLLGWRPGSRSRFRHDASNQLPHTVVVVDETSMVSLSMMASLLRAVRPSARLLLVGDPRQLASVEAGAVLGDIVGPASDGLHMRPDAAALVERVLHEPLAAAEPGDSTSIGDGIVVLHRVHRFGEGIAAVATAIDLGDADAVVAALRSGGDEVTWIEHEVADPARAPELRSVRTDVIASGDGVVAAAERGDSRGALDQLRSVQVICAHRRGPAGAAIWRATIERWLRQSIPGYGAAATHAGQALIVTKNDDALGVFNGDTGVVVDTGDGRLRAVFDRAGEVLQISPTRLDAVEALSAMTIHKSQGSQFGTAIVVLPNQSSRVLTRELLYTGITRAQHRLVVIGSEAAIRAAVARPIARASGLRDALWP